jgi:hypothetical protein
MTTPHEHEAARSVPSPCRRLLLTSILASYASSFIPWSMAQTQSAAPASAAADDEFLSLSTLITGRATLDPAQAKRLHAGLVATMPSFAEQLSALAAFVASNKPAAHDLQSSLDAANAPFAKLPATIATAWYVGVVGSGADARCVTYESSLMNVVVSDRLKPPSYAYGPYGSWGHNPVAA